MSKTKKTGCKTLLAIDPSSTRTGLAVMDYDGNLIEAFAAEPKSTDSADKRIITQCGDVYDLLAATDLDCIVIEGTSGKINKKRHKGSGAGMSVYGMAVGAIWMTCYWWVFNDFYSSIDVIIIPENDWTNGVEKKQRAANMAMVYPQYKPENDPGLDIGDAIGLGRWYVDRERIKNG